MQADKKADIKVAILCAHVNTVYRQLPNVEVFDELRDARTFNGGMPVVAHPPCRAWSRYRWLFAKPEEGEKELAFFCLQAVRDNGGVLEHPAFSRFWDAAGLPLPGEGRDEWDGYTIEVLQYWWGFEAPKKTWLYICGCPIRNLPPIPFRLGNRTSWRTTEYMSRRRRSVTTRELAEWLIKVAKLCGENKLSKIVAHR